MKNRMIVIAPSYQRYKFYCENCGINPNEHLYVSSVDGSSHYKLAGLHIIRDQVVILGPMYRELRVLIEHRIAVSEGLNTTITALRRAARRV